MLSLQMRRDLIGALVWAWLPLSVLSAETAGGLHWTAPSKWSTQQKPMRVANYTVAAAAGDTEGAECGVYFFGRGQGGSAQANVRRWIGQFRTADGKPADGLAKVASRTVNGIKVTTVDISGTHLFKPFPMARRATPKPGYRLLGAIAEGPQAPVFFKFVGSEKTVTAGEADFQRMLDTLRPAK